MTNAYEPAFGNEGNSRRRCNEEGGMEGRKVGQGGRASFIRGWVICIRWGADN